MPNVTWQEPQILLDLLAINIFAELNGLTLPDARHIAARATARSSWAATKA